jgi:hypothetical protein
LKRWTLGESEQNQRFAAGGDVGMTRAIAWGVASDVAKRRKPWEAEMAQDAKKITLTEAEYEALLQKANGKTTVKRRAKRVKVDGKWTDHPTETVVELKMGDRFPLSMGDEKWLDLIGHIHLVTEFMEGEVKASKRS